MKMDTLTFDIYDGATKTSTPRLLQSAVGGEYTQREVDGINANLQKWQIQFIKRAGVEVRDVGDFFDLHQGYKAFLWTPPGDVQRKFTCESYVRTLDHYDVVQSITATLVEVP